jgi:CheY-like chemotaxis protein
MRGRSGGILEVELADHDNGPLRGWTAGREPDRSREYVRLTVRDTGHGIPPEVLPRIFDPFFTTKSAEEGTGMGLAVVHGIVKGCGGLIGVETAADSGTAFHLLLPVVPAGHVGTILPAPATVPRGNNETVLLVDDEVLVLDVTKKILESQGYTVVARHSARSALVTFQATPERFDLVITDQTMPGLTGMELARDLLLIRPGLPMILMTGFSEAVDTERTAAAGVGALVMKPLVPDNLAVLVRRLLDGDKAILSVADDDGQ